MATREHWLLKLVPNLRYGRLLVGIAIALLLLVLFNLGVGENSSDTVPVIFFSLIIAYIVPMFSFITEKSQQALHDLHPVLDLSTADYEMAQAKLSSAGLRATTLQLLGGVSFALVHISYIAGSVSAALSHTLGSIQGLATTLGAILVWLVMTSVMSMLIQQAALFARLGANHVQISLLNTRKLLPFARVSISNSLAVIGALALFPLISIESGLNSAESLPGAIATLIPLIVIFTMPVWPLHKRLASMKEQEIADLSKQIEEYTGTEKNIASNPQLLEKIVPLINYRREISEVSTWPFDAGVVTRLSFYLIIPPITWAGAAVIENLVDSVI
ncbi:MAG: hypothetical protein ACJAUG_001770 [Halioglobus sp.]